MTGKKRPNHDDPFGWHPFGWTFFLSMGIVVVVIPLTVELHRATGMATIEPDDMGAYIAGMIGGVLIRSLVAWAWR